MSNEFSDVYCTEEFAAAIEDYDEETGIMSAHTVLRCAYEDRHALCADVCGNRRPWPKGGFGLTPRAARAGITLAQSANQASTVGQLIASLEALVTVYYSTKVEDIVTESFEPTSEFLTLDHRMFRWASGTGDQLSEDEAPGRQVRGFNFVRTEMYVQPPIPQAIVDLVGTVNDSEIVSDLIPGITLAAETLLFNPPTINRKISSLGAQQFDTVKKWTWNKSGWNTYYRAKTGNHERIYVANASDPYESYPVEDHSALRS